MFTVIGVIAVLAVGWAGGSYLPIPFIKNLKKS